MNTVQLKSQQLTEETFETNAFYVGGGKVYYAFEMWKDGRCISENKRYCYTVIKCGDKEGAIYSSGSYETKLELMKTLRGYSCRKVNFHMSEI